MAPYTLDQLVVFVTVADSGGFSAAARQLGRAQSAVTYAIRGLEEQSGLLLFDRTGYRAALTDQGRALLPRARQIVADTDDLYRQAQGFAKGLEAELTVVVEPFVPMATVGAALRKLHATHSSVRARVIVEDQGKAMELMDQGKAQLAVLVHTAPMTNDFDFSQCTVHDLIAVAAPSHPLAQINGVVSSADLRPHLQLVWTPPSAAPDSADLGVHATDRWYITDIQAKRELLASGVGWGSLPDHIAAADIARGRLVALQLESWEGSDRMPQYRTIVSRRKGSISGPAARLLFESLRGPRVD